jgi:hypothetical protein
MMSSRYAPAVCVAVVLALIPTIIHSYAGVVVTDSLKASAISPVLGAYTSTPTERSADWGERRFDSHDWIEREYRSATDSVVLTVIRSYDLKALYHHPELAVAYHSASFSTADEETFPEFPDMPVHVLSNGDAGPVALYVLHYDGRFVADPIRFQIRAAGELLFTGRKAMTLFFVRDDSVPTAANPLALPAATLLVSAVQQFVGPGSSAR